MSISTKCILSSLLCLAGLPALVWFDWYQSIFNVISPDGEISSFMILRFRIVLISLLPVGLVLLFGNRLRQFAAKLIYYIHGYTANKFVFGVLGAGFLLRLVIAWVYPFELWIDYAAYDELARNIVQSGCYCIDGIPTAYRPPGYPVFVAGIYYLFGHFPQLAALFNIIPSLLIILYGYLIGRKTYGERAGRITAVILMLFPSQILFCNLPASEVLFTALLMMAVYLIIDNTGMKNAVVAGISIGLAALVRPIALIVPLAVLGHLLQNQKSKKRNLIMFVLVATAMIVTVSPWVVRNHAKKGSLTISTSAGINLLAGNSPGAGMGWNPRAVEGLPIGDPGKELYVDSVGKARALEYIGDDPGGFVRRGILKTAYLFAVDLEGVDYQIKESAEKGRASWYVWLAVIVQTYYYIVLLLALMGIALMFRRLLLQRGMILWLMVLLWIAVHFVFYAEGRYHFPLIPAISLAGAVYLDRWNKADAQG